MLGSAPSSPWPIWAYFAFVQSVFPTSATYAYLPMPGTEVAGAAPLLVAPPQGPSQKVVFSSNRDGYMQIYQMNPDGSGQTRLTYNSSNDDNPRWSPNGAKILFQSDRDRPDTGYMDIYVMTSGGSGQMRLTSDANDDSEGVV